jgi:hypothetical protein
MSGDGRHSHVPLIVTDGDVPRVWLGLDLGEVDKGLANLDPSLGGRRPEDVLLVGEALDVRESLRAEHGVEVDGMVVDEADETGEDLSVPVRVSLVAAGDELM